MARCSYLYDDGERCVYDHWRIIDGAMCDVHVKLSGMRAARRRSNAKGSARRSEARRQAREQRWAAEGFVRGEGQHG